MTNLQKYMELQNGLSADEVRAMDNVMIGALSVYTFDSHWNACAESALRSIGKDVANKVTK